MAESRPNEQDVVDVLTNDHREVEGLIVQIWAASDPGRRRELADVMISELVRHAVAEELFVYPAMRRYLPDGDAAVEHDTREHEDLERTMKSLEGVDASEPRFEELVRHLEETLRDHVADEEGEHFPQLRALIPHDDLVQMAERVQAAKAVAPTRPHPSTPNDPVAHALLGPGVGLVDRLRDKLSGRSTG